MMRTPTDSYWAKRSKQRMASYHRDADSTVKTITDAYDKAIKDLYVEIEKIFNVFSKDGKLDPERARRLLNQTISNPLLELAKKIYPEIKDERVKRWLLNKMNAPAYRARITRLQALKEQIYLQSKVIADVEITASTAGYVKTMKEAYYRTMFDIQHGLGVGFEFAAMSDQAIQSILKNPWSGEHFSKRIWRNTDVLAAKLTETITAGFMSGASIEKMANDIEHMSEIGKHAANRIVRTETTYMANAAEMESYQEADIDQYIYVATLDNRTSDVCRDHDSKVYNVKYAEPGKNSPPLHPYCRSTTRAYFGKDTLKNIQRRARDPKTGETYLVPADMSYEKWYNEYVLKPEQVAKRNEIERAKERASKEIQEYISNNPDKLKVNKNRYENHNPNHKRYKDYVERNKVKGKRPPSYLSISYDEANELVKRYAGTGNPVINTKTLEWVKKEDIFSHSKPIGVHIDQTTGKETVTSSFRIHYSKTGTHIVPTIEGGEE